MIITLNCKNCGKSFSTKEYRLKTGRGKYCSRECSNLKTHFKKGAIPKNKGKKGWTNSGSFKPKDGNLTYTGVHAWVRRRLGSPLSCEMCQRNDRGKYQWANISGEYKKDLSDWKRLCYWCHRKFDSKIVGWGRMKKIFKGNQRIYV